MEDGVKPASRNPSWEEFKNEEPAYLHDDHFHTLYTDCNTLSVVLTALTVFARYLASKDDHDAHRQAHSVQDLYVRIRAHGEFEHSVHERRN